MAFQLDSPEAIAMMATITGMVTKALQEALSGNTRTGASTTVGGATLKNKQQKLDKKSIEAISSAKRKQSRHDRLALVATRSKKREERPVRRVRSEVEMKTPREVIKTREQIKKESKKHKKIRRQVIIESSSEEEAENVLEEVEEKAVEVLEVVEKADDDIGEEFSRAGEDIVEKDSEGGSVEELERVDEVDEEIEEDSESDFAPASPRKAESAEADDEPRTINKKPVSYDSREEEDNEPVSKPEANVEGEQEQAGSEIPLCVQCSDEYEDLMEFASEAETNVEEETEELSATGSPVTIQASDDKEDEKSVCASETEIEEQISEAAETQPVSVDLHGEEADSGYASEVDDSGYNSNMEINEQVSESEETRLLKEELSDGEDSASVHSVELEQNKEVPIKTGFQLTIEDSNDEDFADPAPTPRSRKLKRTFRPTWNLRLTKKQLITPSSNDEDEEEADSSWDSEVELFELGGIPDPRMTWPVVEIPPKSEEVMQSIERDYIPYKPKSHKRREYSEESEEPPTPPRRTQSEDSAADSDPDYSLPVPRRGPDGKFLASNARFNYAQYIQQKAAKEKERKEKNRERKSKTDPNEKNHSANPQRKSFEVTTDGSDSDAVVPRKWILAPGPIPESLLNAEGWYQQDLAILMGYKIEPQTQDVPAEIKVKTPAPEIPSEPMKPVGRKRAKSKSQSKQTAKKIVKELVSVPSSPDDDLRQEFLPPPSAAHDARRRASPVPESVIRYAEEMAAWCGDEFEPRSGRRARSSRRFSSDSEPAPKPKPKLSKKKKADDARAREAERLKVEDMHRKAIEAQEIMEIMQERSAKKRRASSRRETLEKASSRRYPVTRSPRVPSQVPDSGGEREEGQHQAKRYRPSRASHAPAPAQAANSYYADQQRRGTSESTLLGMHSCESCN